MSARSGPGERVLLTGATGFLGREILRVLLRTRPEARLVLLARGSADQSAARRVEALLERGCGSGGSESLRRRIQVFEADTSAPRCGLSERDWAAAAEGVTEIIHAAAAVRFDAPEAEARRANTEGARNLLELGEAAARKGSLRAFSHVSTAFVAGRRKGLVREDELAEGQRFRNSYERTKYEAELLVRERMRDLPAVILRPSIVAGDSRSGATTSFHTLYWPLRIYAQRRWRIVPGRPETPLDIVPVDFVAEAAVHLTFRPEALGRTLHLCAGPSRGSTVGEIAAAASRYFRVPPPRFVSPGVFLAALRPLLFAAVWGRRRRILRNGALYRPYLSMQLEFDTTQADALLAPAGIQPPRVMDYLERLFAYCLETDWGRRHDAALPPSRQS
ncbi:MAG: SDR family oxidoreductase [Bryobacterales bacterium]|nr:SDR family oxidoreductase [Bryobacterales bacterium]